MDGDVNKELKRTAQNFQIDIQEQEEVGENKSLEEKDESMGSFERGKPEESVFATFVMRLTDAAENILPGLTVELHSIPKVTQTDANGIVIASKSFEVDFGERVFLDGEQLTVKKNVTSTLNIQMKNNELIFLSLQEGDIYQMLPPQTGDAADPAVWIVLIFLSCSIGVGVYLYDRKKKCPK